MTTIQSMTCVLLAGLAVLPARFRAQDLVLTNARIVDVEHRSITRGALWIRGGVVQGTGARPPAGAPGRRVDLDGRWVIPGLVDLHTHSWGNSGPGAVFDGPGTAAIADRVVRAGVVAFLDLFAVEDSIFALRDAQRDQSGPAADIHAAGPCFTATRGHCSQFGLPTRIVDTPIDARREVAAVARRRPDVIKVVYDHRQSVPGLLPSIDRATLEALVEMAHSHRLPVVAHIGSWDDAWDAAMANVDAITHTPEDRVVPDSVAQLLASRGVRHIATLVVHTEMATMVDSVARREDALLRTMTTPEVLASYAPGVADTNPRLRSRIVAQRRIRPTVLASVRRLHRAGVVELTGSDAANLGAFQGYSVHRELELLVAAGLSPWDALAGASTRAGAFLGRRLGVTSGDRGDLIVLDASPIADIAHTKRIHAVVRRGQWLPSARSPMP